MPVLTAAYAGGNEVELSWTAVTGAVKYALFAQLVSEPGWRQLDEGDLTATTYRHRGLTPGASYQYAVRGVDAGGRALGSWSNYPVVTVPASGADTATPTTTPASGATVTPTATVTAASTSSVPVLTAAYAGGNEVELSWTAVSGAVRYALFAQLVSEPGWQQLDAGDLTDTTYRHRGLTPGASYQYAVRGVDAAGRVLGSWSNFPVVTVPASGADTATPTATPASGATVTATATVTAASTSSVPVLTAAYAGGNEVELSWTAVSGAVRYALFAQLVGRAGLATTG